MTSRPDLSYISEGEGSVEGEENAERDSHWGGSVLEGYVNVLHSFRTSTYCNSYSLADSTKSHLSLSPNLHRSHNLNLSLIKFSNCLRPRHHHLTPRLESPPLTRPHLPSLLRHPYRLPKNLLPSLVLPPRLLELLLLLLLPSLLPVQTAQISDVPLDEFQVSFDLSPLLHP